jgi:hypothetical protein
MPSCLGCGKALKELSRKKVKEPGTKNDLIKAAFSCPNPSCPEKGMKKFFLMNGMMVIPVSE